MKKILLVFGTRPEAMQWGSAVKQALVSASFSGRAKGAIV